jgi:hypothetical protein
MATSPGADWAHPPIEAVRTRLRSAGVPVSIPAGEPHTQIEKLSAALA